MGELKPYGIDFGMYEPGITKEIRRHVQTLNRSIILATASSLVKTAVVSEVVTAPLVGLVCISPIVKDGCELKLEIGHEASKIRIADAISNECLTSMSFKYPLGDEPHILEICRDIDVKPECQGNGLGLGLFFTEDCVTRRAMRLLGFDSKMIHIYAHQIDDTANRDQHHQRAGWARAVSLHAGYSSNFDLLVRYLGKEDAIRFRNRSTIKVYQDIERGVFI